MILTTLLVGVVKTDDEERKPEIPTFKFSCDGGRYFQILKMQQQ